jgi:glycosyltransferase involved in cell wall biosynthesis
VRFLIHPRPSFANSVGIFLHRISQETEARGYEWTAQPFHYLGFSIQSWQAAFLMGVPRYLDRVLKAGTPSVLTMGKSQSREEAAAYDLPFTSEHERQEQLMLDAIRRAPRIVFISEYVRSLWQGIYSRRGISFPESARVRVIHHGVDLAQFCPAPPPVGPFVLGSAGAHRFRFRLETLFQVSRRLPFDHSVLIVGSLDSHCRSELEKALRDPEIKRRTTWIPWIQADDLPRWYSRMHCLFHPVDHEGCGIVCVEALACGVPVVVPAHGAPQEYLGGGGIAVDGPRFRYDDAFCDRMAEAVVRIKGEHAAYSAKAREAAERGLSMTRVMDGYLDLLGLPRSALGAG